MATFEIGARNCIFPVPFGATNFGPGGESFWTRGCISFRVDGELPGALCRFLPQAHKASQELEKAPELGVGLLVGTSLWPHQRPQN